MTHLTLISESPLQLQPLIQTALTHENEAVSIID